VPGKRYDVTIDQLRAWLAYEPETGLVRWRVTKGQRAKEGAIAGSLNRDKRSGYFYVQLGAKSYMLRLLKRIAMPPVSQQQRKLMHAAANSPAVAKKTGVKQSVAKEFAAADKPGKLPKRVKAGRPARGRGV